MRARINGKQNSAWLTAALWLALAMLGLLHFGGVGVKWMTLLAGIGVIALLVLGDRKRIWNLPSLLLLGYAAFSWVTIFWAMSGKFHLREGSKLLIAVFFFLLVAMHKKFDGAFARRVMGAIAGISAIYALLSIEAVSTGLTKTLLARLPALDAEKIVFQNSRLNGIFGNANIEASIYAIGIFCAMLVAMVLLGGIKRIGSVSEKLVPFMALFYVVLGIGVVLLNLERLPGVLQSIFEGAFNPAAFTGGIIGSLFVSMQKGVSRGIFSNEAGLGTGSIAHACADTQKPVTQGMFGIFEVFADTIIICTLTALVILCSGTPVTYGVAAGAELTISGFTTTYGSWSSIFTAVALCCFAFSTIIGWGLYGSRFVQFLFKSNKVVRPFLVIYSFVSILGATLDLGLLWDIADTFNGLMSIPNLIALLLLSGMVVKLTKEHFPGKGAVRKTGE